MSHYCFAEDLQLGPTALVPGRLLHQNMVSRLRYLYQAKNEGDNLSIGNQLLNGLEHADTLSTLEPDAFSSGVALTVRSIETSQ